MHDCVAKVDGVAYEITTPYLVADLTNTYGSFRPSFVQSNDVVFWANAGYFPQMLERARFLRRAGFTGGWLGR